MENLQELLSLLNSGIWPAAIEPFDFHNEGEKYTRAKNIIEIAVDKNFENLKFLDFGCGEGHVVDFIRTQKPKMVVGYDIRKHNKWGSWGHFPNTLYTNIWSDLEVHAPFDGILLWDVIDHMMEEEIIPTLSKLKSFLLPYGKIYVRTHPWTSRHGTHLYLTLNKAYAHLVFDNDTLKSLGFHQEEIIKIKSPLSEYINLFQKAGLQVDEGPYITTVFMDPFFTEKKIVKNAIAKTLGNEFPKSELEIQFLDYVLF